jgi:Ca2+-binding EF-hand superfamily protein
MQTINRTLLALALGALFAAPAMASDKDPVTGQVKTPTSTASHASDAVSARATTRETGRMKAPTTTTAGATGTGNANPGRGNWWADADIDGDGKLNIGEAKAQAGLEARFSNVDADSDGFVTNDEYRNFFTDSASQGEANASAHSAVVTRDLWTQLDGNSDGKLSASEVSANSAISSAFRGMDVNGDGFVTQAEYTAYVKADTKK